MRMALGSLVKEIRMTGTLHCDAETADLIPGRLRDSWPGGHYHVDMLDKGTIPVLGWVEQDGTRFHYATQNDVQVKTYALFVSGVFHLTSAD